MKQNWRRCLLALLCLQLIPALLLAQTSLKLHYEQSEIYAGIEVGSKGVKLSMLEMGPDARNTGAYYLLKDTAVNSDFISFTPAAYQATLAGLYHLYELVNIEYKIPADHIYTVISSGVKIQAEKEEKTDWIRQLSDAFRQKINEPGREVAVIDVKEEARLSHLGIVPDSRRYTTFLIDIGSGNTKGGYFPYANTRDLKLFQLSWGTKSVANAAEKRCDTDKSTDNYYRQLGRVLQAAENTEIVYAVNESGSYDMSDNVAFSGGIAWSLATLAYPELIDNPVVPVTYDELVKFNDRIISRYASLSDSAIVAGITDNSVNTAAVAREVKRVNQVFDQRALMAGTGLLLKVMRQFAGVYEKKQFFLVKNGQVGWISAYVNKSLKK
ncbi:MAG: hypothetical protein U0X40_04555 [Ferruginibacter sp.]